MSAAAPTANAGAAPAKTGKKKLIIIVGVLLLVLVFAGGAVVMLMKNKAHAADAEGDDAPAEHKSIKIDPKHVPSYLPLDAFVVNLSDKDADRYAQIGITLEIDDAKTAESMKTYMPAIRSAILMILSHKTSAELLTPEGKESLAAEIMRESVRPIGIDIDPPDADEAGKASAKSKDSVDDDTPKKKSKKKKKSEEHNPVQRVLFSNFIIQ